MKFNQYDCFSLVGDLGPEIKEGMRGVVLEVYNEGEAYEVEFVKDDGTNYRNGDQAYFTLYPGRMNPLNKMET